MMTSPSLFSLSSARVLAFAKDWSLDSLDAATMQALRERIRSLGAELLVVTDRGTWAFCPEDDGCEYRDRIAGDLATASTLMGARSGADAVFVIDGARVVRVGHGSPHLMAALDAAAELLITRRLIAQAPPVPFASLHRWMEQAS
jgi:hypothetical protein